MRKNDGWTIKYGRLAKVYGRQEHEQWIAEKSKNKTKQIRLLEEQKAKLKEQLNEANEALKQVYDRTLNAEEWSKHNNRLFEIANNYLEKWGLE